MRILLLTFGCLLTIVQTFIHSHQHEDSCRSADFKCDSVIKEIKNQGISISQPGYYCLGKDIQYDPDKRGKPAIRISASNVTLDLNGRTLMQASKNVLGVNGIVVDPGLTNVIIKNGTIRDFSLRGILIGTLPASSTKRLGLTRSQIKNGFKSDSTTYLPISKSSSQNDPGQNSEIVVTHIRAFNNGIQDPSALVQFDGMGGITILNATDVSVLNCDLNSNFAAGFWGAGLIKFTMDQTHCDDNQWANFGLGATTEAGLTVAAGALLTGGASDSITIKNSTFNRNFSQLIVYGFNFGFFSNVTNVLVDHCQANANSLILSDPIVVQNGLAITGEVDVWGYKTTGTSYIFRNCEAHAGSLTLTIPSGDQPNTVHGFLIVGDNMTLSDCTVDRQVINNNTGISASEFNDSFFCSTTRNIVLQRCITTNNSISHAPTPTGSTRLTVTGYSFTNCGNVLFEDCVSSGHSYSGINPSIPDQNLEVMGMNLAFSGGSRSGPITLRRCFATTHIDPFNGFAAGFAAFSIPNPNGIAFIFEDCVADRNTSAQGIGAGISLNSIQNSKVVNCKAQINNIGIFVSETNPGESVNNIFTGNILSANTQFGIQDLTTALRNAYYANQAKNNGPTPASTNYNGTTFPIASCLGDCVSANKTPVLFWSLPDGPCPFNSNCIPANDLDNLSIVN